MRIKAVIDRIVDGEHAVLLVGEMEEELLLPVTQLPENANEGTWVKIDLDGDVIHSIQVDQDDTITREERIKSKMERLRQRSKRNNK
ncbi:DUF3006 domain-containing protein [Evansella sp. AB-P1]|uniref:DUF3006 domain-containing protein n=1 Tax=Evansella sp. AB-P1 TaxID=3037653 RepID=UPI00241E19BB|nr:DUF3006 domain-containing protein [Evansella sp. AB-P1]MDG5787144.1 DUF3006 domain-containing protein [Evansella sp. AB-P1]